MSLAVDILEVSCWAHDSPRIYFTCREFYKKWKPARQIVLTDMMKAHRRATIMPDEHFRVNYRLCGIKLLAVPGYITTEYTICGRSRLIGCCNKICKCLFISRIYWGYGDRYHIYEYDPFNRLKYIVYMHNAGLTTIMMEMLNHRESAKNINLSIFHDDYAHDIYSEEIELRTMNIISNNAIRTNFMRSIDAKVSRIIEYMNSTEFDSSEYLGAALIGPLKGIGS